MSTPKTGLDGRKKLIMAGLWTEVCAAMPAIQALDHDYAVAAGPAQGSAGPAAFC